MVLKPSRRRTRRVILWRNIALFVICMATSYTAMRIVIGQSLTEFVQQNIIPALTKEKRPDFIDMQNLVEDFASHQSGTVSAVIYDIDNDRYSAIYDSDRRMNTASLYKLFPVYENYLRMEDGTFSKDDIIYKTTRDDKKVEYTREKCADLAIRESHSPCAEAMVDEIGWETLDQIDQDRYDLINTSGLTSTAGDIAKILMVYYEHKDLSDETWAKIKDSMLNQPKTKVEGGKDGEENDWRQGLPSGFHTAKVYNKVGWEGSGTEKNKWKIYNDAAIVEFPEDNRHFIIVVMTENIDPKAISNLGNYIEQAIIAGTT